MELNIGQQLDMFAAKSCNTAGRIPVERSADDTCPVADEVAIAETHWQNTDVHSVMHTVVDICMLSM